MQWFDIDKQGLARLLERKGKSFAIFELVQNAWDERTSIVDINLVRIPSSPFVNLTVEDDNPEGFADLSHAFTLFADSKKKDDAEKRGRFNLGEKLVLALCSEASIASTTGTIVFDKDGRHKKRATREKGSLFTGTLRMNQAEIAECESSVRLLLPPEGIQTIFNGEPIPSRKPVTSFIISLPTEIADNEGVLRKTTRKTSVRVFEPQAGETPTLYELGIPVVETADKWHLDVAQKVPLNFDRDNVPPSYLSRLRAATLDAMNAQLNVEDANATWVRDAMQSHGETLSEETISHVMDLRFGEKRVPYDPSDPEANKLAVSKGYTVVHGNQLSKPEWEAIRRVGAIAPAGQVTPSPKPYIFSPDGVPINFLDESEWTDAMKGVAAFTKRMAVHGIQKNIHVSIVNEPGRYFGACYSQESGLQFNLGRLGKSWFAPTNMERIMKLVIHELGHEFSGDHLSSEFHEGLCQVGMKLALAAVEHPDEFHIKMPEAHILMC